MFRLELSVEAIKDLDEIIAWHESNQPGLGLKFLATVQITNKVLLKHPFHSIRYGKIRCVVIQGFPYMIHYRIFQKREIILISAVYHTSRKPKR